MCDRCLRAVEGDAADDETVVCTGCITAFEDAEETRGVVALLIRHAGQTSRGLADPEWVQSTVRATLKNLGQRIGLVPQPALEKQVKPFDAPAGEAYEPTWMTRSEADPGQQAV